MNNTVEICTSYGRVNKDRVEFYKRWASSI